MDSLKKGYLLLYNATQLIGNFCVIVSIARFMIEHKTSTDSYHLGSNMIRILLTLQWLEILHTIIGLAKGSPVTSFCQVLGKSIVFFAFMDSSAVPSEVTSAKTSGILLLAWALGDSIRFLFYFQNQIGLSLSSITWIRYSAWMVLYPIGITCEGITLLLNLGSLKSSGRFAYPLPNHLNISFDPSIAIYIYVVVILPMGSHKMLSYMWSQRQRALATFDRKAQ
jgi:very-long-chain (3R)-3-hydroxyacyl-CoA dehydratase